MQNEREENKETTVLFDFFVKMDFGYIKLLKKKCLLFNHFCKYIIIFPIKYLNEKENLKIKLKVKIQNYEC